MAKIRDDYEKTLWRKLVRFVNGETVEETFPQSEEDENNAVKLSKEKKAEIEAEKEKRFSAVASLMADFDEWPEFYGMKLFKIFSKIVSFAIGIGIILVLLYTVSNLPSYGNVNNPINNEVYDRYVEEGIKETGATNIVAGVILDYRAFDTLGESHVLFIAACCVLILLRIDSDGKNKSAIEEAEQNDRIYEPKNDIIIQTMAKYLVLIIMLFGIYVIFNGHLSPGGGFSGGAIIGAGLILYLNAYGFKKTERFFTNKTFSVVSVSALVFYAGAKGYSFFTGANHLESIIRTGIPGKIISAGLILPLNIAVGMVVACTMYSFYALFRKGGM